MQITIQITSNTCNTILASGLTVVGIIHTGNNTEHNFVISLHTLSVRSIRKQEDIGITWGGMNLQNFFYLKIVILVTEFKTKKKSKWLFGLWRHSKKLKFEITCICLRESWPFFKTKGAYHSEINIFNSLPTEIKDFSDNTKKFKTTLKHFLYSHAFYTLDVYLNR